MAVVNVSTALLVSRERRNWFHHRSGVFDNED